MLHHMARCGGLCKIVAIEIIIRKPAPAGNLAALRGAADFPTGIAAIRDAALPPSPHMLSDQIAWAGWRGGDDTDAGTPFQLRV
jgi:hypothetical protein